MDKLVPCLSCDWRSKNGINKTDCRDCENTGYVQDPETILCNMCGHTMCPLNASCLENAQIPHGLVDQQVAGSYDSEYLTDCVQYTFSLCEKCLRKMFLKFKIKPLVETIDGDFSFDEEQKNHEYYLWVSQGKNKTAYARGFCNAKKNCKNKAVFTLFCNGEITDHSYCQSCFDERQVSSNGYYEFKQFVPNKLKILL